MFVRWQLHGSSVARWGLNILFPINIDKPRCTWLSDFHFFIYYFMLKDNIRVLFQFSKFVGDFEPVIKVIQTEIFDYFCPFFNKVLSQFVLRALSFTCSFFKNPYQSEMRILFFINKFLFKILLRLSYNFYPCMNKTFRYIRKYILKNYEIVYFFNLVIKESNCDQYSFENGMKNPPGIFSTSLTNNDKIEAYQSGFYILSDNTRHNKEFLYRIQGRKPWTFPRLMEFFYLQLILLSVVWYSSIDRALTI